ncbi:MAG: enoyl-ACP reductase FabI [Actinomycetota bacterium]|nr:enoyl-ACP reductase FabI [Actinomycetota bacterium]
MALLEGKRILVTGVLTEASLAFSVAKVAQAEGAEVILTGAGRGMALTRRTAKRLPSPVDVLELDVTQPDQLASAADTVASHWDHLDGLLHGIGFAPQSCLGQGMMAASWQEVGQALEISSFSLKALTEAFLPLLTAAGKSSVVGLDFDASVAWPAYDWMGVAKAALESLSRYLARDLARCGVRVNLVSAGPIRSMAAKGIPSFGGFEEVWKDRAPLGWDVNDSSAVGKACVALLSDWFPMTTGEIVHVDGGFHAMGA